MELWTDRITHRLANDLVDFDKRVRVEAPAHNIHQGVQVASGSPESDRYARLVEHPSNRQCED